MTKQQLAVRSILGGMNLMAWAVDREGIIVMSEGGQLQGLGIKPGELEGKSMFDLYGSHEGALNSVRRTLAGERFETSFPVGDRFIENRYFPLLDEANEVIGAAGVSLDVTDQARAQEQREQQEAALKAQAELLDLAHDAIMARGLDGKITYWNRGAERMYGYSKTEALEQTSHALLKPTLQEDAKEIERCLLESGYWEGELTHTRRDGRAIAVQSRLVLKQTEGGAKQEVLEINTDITERKEAEQERARQQEELIRTQARAIVELSTPLIPITDEVLVMPIIGTIDSSRAQQVMESLLGGLSASRGAFAILDITGVPVVDTHAANALIRAAHAARLLGAEVILTGIRPEVARTLASIDMNLDGITTRGTLQSGFAFALGRRALSRSFTR